MRGSSGRFSLEKQVNLVRIAKRGAGESGAPDVVHKCHPNVSTFSPLPIVSKMKFFLYYVPTVLSSVSVPTLAPFSSGLQLFLASSIGILSAPFPLLALLPPCTGWRLDFPTRTSGGGSHPSRRRATQLARRHRQVVSCA